MVSLAVLLTAATARSEEPPPPRAPALPGLRPSPDGTRFIRADTGQPLALWGVNYDHDASGRLLEDYWEAEWETVVQDFGEIKALGANVVRIHLQLGRFLEAAERPNQANLERLARLVKLAEETGLYLDVTGLGCYHKRDVPPWYDALGEAARWDVQARFWQAIAGVCRTSSAIFCYDLMNEPILPGEGKAESQWLSGELGGKFFVQRISLDLAGRPRQAVAAAWVQRLTGAIREVDREHMLTVGVIPWAQVFKGAKPLFYAPEVHGPLDFVSVHFYPKSGKLEDDLAALAVYEIGKPLVVEEIFPLSCSVEEAGAFINRSRTHADGWISFYWGRTIAENERQGDLQGALVAAWLRYFRDHAPRAAFSTE
jgi:hypothetical protein